jgi:hypothetical protein
MPPTKPKPDAKPAASGKIVARPSASQAAPAKGGQPASAKRTAEPTEEANLVSTEATNPVSEHAVMPDEVCAWARLFRSVCWFLVATEAHDVLGR